MRITRHCIPADHCGFTLIEILVTIVISAVLAVILAQVVSSQTARSYAPLQTLDGNLALRAVMENITAEYRQLQQAGSVDLDSFRADIIDAEKPYWDEGDITNSINITADTDDTRCIIFDPDSDNAEATAESCAVANVLLKVTLRVDDTQHRLTVLFAP